MENRLSKREIFLKPLHTRTHGLMYVLQQIEDKRSQKELEPIYEEMTQLVQKWKKKLESIKDSNEQIQTLFKMIEEEFSKQNLEDVQCKKGCSACCHWKVEISKEEANYLASLIRKKKIPLDKAQLKKQSQYHRDHPIWKQIPSSETRCVFLDSTGACSIHPHRPLSCRKCLVVSPAENCKTPNENKITPLYILEVELLVSLAWTLFSEGDTLPRALWQSLSSEFSMGPPILKG